VFHNVPQTRATWSYFRSRCYAEGLSKALVSRLVGANSSLSSEKAYVARALPQAVIRGIGDALLRLDTGGVQRAFAVGLGLFLTGMGYLAGTATLTLRQRFSKPAPNLSLASQPQNEL
jgi:hypothetical protein